MNALVDPVSDHVARLVASSVRVGTALVAGEHTDLAPALARHGYTTVAVELAADLPAETVTAPPVVAVVYVSQSSRIHEIDSTIEALTVLVDRFTPTGAEAPLLVVALPNTFDRTSPAFGLRGDDADGEQSFDSTAVALHHAAVRQGFVAAVAADVPDPLDPPRSTPLSDLLDDVAARARLAPRASHLVRSLRRSRQHPDPAPAPFLSVIVRTQGQRSTLVDTLTSLAAQRDGDLEVLLMVHNAEAAELERVERLAAAFGSPFAARIRVTQVSGGGRSAPLNAALEIAHGEYVAILDDDDVVTSGWVSAFRRAAALAPGRMIRARCAVQWIERRGGALTDFEPVTGLSAPYPARFDLLDNIRSNRSPPCTYAVPRSLVTTLGLRFDDALQVCEDWKFELDAARLVGVSDDPEVTSIYRRWRGDGGSEGAEDERVWIDDHMRVVADLDSVPTVLPAGSLERIHQLYERIEHLEIELGRRDGDDDPARFGPEG